MPRTLPWKTPPKPRPTDAPPSKRPKLNAVSPLPPSPPSPDLPTSSVSHRNKPPSSTNQSTAADQAPAAAAPAPAAADQSSPIASSPLTPPQPQYIQPGRHADDAWRVVEDELLATAHVYTRHLHRAEYRRVKAAAQARKAQAVQAVQGLSLGGLGVRGRGRGLDKTGLDKNGLDKTDKDLERAALKSSRSTRPKTKVSSLLAPALEQRGELFRPVALHGRGSRLRKSKGLTGASEHSGGVDSDAETDDNHNNHNNNHNDDDDDDDDNLDVLAKKQKAGRGTMQQVPSDQNERYGKALHFRGHGEDRQDGERISPEPAYRTAAGRAWLAGRERKTATAESATAESDSHVDISEIPLFIA